MHESNSQTYVERQCRNLYKTKNAPTRASINKWYENFKEAGDVPGSKVGRKPLGDIPVENVKTHEESPKTSIRKAHAI